MTWKSFHNRAEVLRNVAEVADFRRDGVLPTDVEGVTEVFASDLALLGALQLRWHTRLNGQIERALVEQPMDLEGAVVAAWHRTHDEMPGIRAVIDHHRTSSEVSDEVAGAMRKAAAKEHMLLAVMAGQAGVVAGGGEAASVRAGARIEGRARATYRPIPPHKPVEPSWLERLRTALTAA